MAVRSIKNQYLGINAHLHSLWQVEGGWSEFHSGYLLNLFYALRPGLVAKGYKVALESSLQIRYKELPPVVEQPESDLTIYDLDPVRPLQPQTIHHTGTAVELVLPIVETLLEPPVSEKTYSAIKIYKTRAGQGEPIVWIELLSPSNKPRGGDTTTEYLRKRDKIVESGIALVEIDFLNESRPTLRQLPVYPDSKAHPYRIIIFDPRPSMRQGVARIAEFDVDTPIPSPDIPLSADDILTLDFSAPYQETLTRAAYGLDLVDYSHLPLHFERYSADDQARIVNRMLAVLEAAKTGLDLETGPFPAKSLPLDEALMRLKNL
jgi:hypothetical protein